LGVGVDSLPVIVFTYSSPSLTCFQIKRYLSFSALFLSSFSSPMRLYKPITFSYAFSVIGRSVCHRCAVALAAHHTHIFFFLSSLAVSFISLVGGSHTRPSLSLYILCVCVCVLLWYRWCCLCWLSLLFHMYVFLLPYLPFAFFLLA
jgi:hypothetical protein